MVDGCAQFVAKLVQVGLLRGEGLFAQVLIDEREQAVTAASDSLQVAHETLRGGAARFLEQNLAEADDVVDGGSEVVADFGERALLRWVGHGSGRILDSPPF